MTQNVTIFRNIKDTSTPFYRSVDHVLDRIKSGKSKALVQEIRKEKDKEKRNEIKKQLPAICFSGIFIKRSDHSLSEHSGLVCLDFDGYPKMKDLLADKEKMKKDKYVYSVFVSPSGNGLKVLVKIPMDTDNHKNYFNSLSDHFNSSYFDKTSSNVSRVCYESYDPLIYINTNSVLWDKISEPEYTEVVAHKDPPSIPITDENKIVDILIKWWTKKYPMIEGQRNHNVYVLAMAFNDYGINKSLAGYVLHQYQSESFSINEINRTIDSAYTNRHNFGSKYYEDEDRINQIKAKLKRGVSKKEIKNDLKDDNLSLDVIDAVLDRVEEEGSVMSFWSKNEKGVIKIVPILFKEFLEENGFYKYCPEGSSNYVFVRVTNNLVSHTFEEEIKDFVLNYLIKLDDLSVYNYFAEKVAYFKENFLTLLGTIDIHFIEDTKEEAYLYYLNYAIKVSKDGVECIDYLDLGGYVWKDHVIERNFSVNKSLSSDYQTFILRVSGGDESRVKTIESTIGFMMHGYKNLSFCPAVVLNDEVISDNPEGGTGKGLFINALSQMKKVVSIDGKLFNFEKSFPYQLVSADTQILCFDDVKKYFEFERLFSLITEGLTLEKKNKDAIKIPFSRSPKIAITTNYALKGSGNSFDRRKWEVEFFQHYSKKFTPLDEFGKHLFKEWDDEEWLAFDNYMIDCLTRYLDTGLVETKFVNLKKRQLSAETSHDFIEWCGLVEDNNSTSNMPIGAKLMKQDLYYEFISEYPDYAPKAKMTISRIRFYKWLNAYALYVTGQPPEEGRDPEGRWLRLKAPIKKKDDKQSKINFK